MSKIWIGTGITHSYLERAEPYLVSLRKHEPDRSWVFTVDFRPGQDIGLKSVFVDYSKCLNVDKQMLQHGGFVTHAPPEWSGDDVVVFTDADINLQRPLTDDECAMLVRGTLSGGVMIGRNKPDPAQTLEDEAHALFPHFPHQGLPSWLERRFPGFALMRCANTGVVATRLSTWRMLYNDFKSRWADVVWWSGHYARVQWLICYTVQATENYRLEPLPLSFHAHGHLGMPPGVTIDPDGVARFEGRAIAFRHAL